MKVSEINKLRSQFPLLTQQVNQRALVYFDNAATSQKPKTVIESELDYYTRLNSNVHRSSHALSAQTTLAFENARKTVQKFINASSDKQVIWTKGATESINLVASSWARTTLLPSDEIVLSYAEHHANIVPWQLIAQQTGARIKILPLSETGVIDEGELENIITPHTKIVCVSHISNVIGKVNPISKIISKAKQVGALTLIDGSQAVAHLAIDVQALDCDFYVFSAHKMYGPTGVGVLYGKLPLLTDMPPYQAGGEMIERVSFTQTTFNELPFKFEAGTPNIAGIISFAKAVEFIEQNELLTFEQALVDYTYTKLTKFSEINFVSKGKPDIPLFSFTIENHHNHDVATALDSMGIAVRAGHHCAMPLMTYLKLNGCIRVSLAPYNTFAEVDFFIDCLSSILLKTKTTVATPFNKTLSAHNTKVAEYISPEIILAKFQQCKSWDSKHREIMLLGKNLVGVEPELKVEQNLISGCESNAWLTHNINNNHYTFEADSDAKVIKGLLVIILSVYQGKTKQEILAFDINAYFAELGLLQHLSPSRNNGVQAIVQRIMKLVIE
jgi:SufS family cysteine desulfurase